jgi:hypothetical protein
MRVDMHASGDALGFDNKQPPLADEQVIYLREFTIVPNSQIIDYPNVFRCTELAFEIEGHLLFCRVSCCEAAVGVRDELLFFKDHRSGFNWLGCVSGL